ncbi:MAG: hypothetical protein QM761_10660 [Pseudoxanthomonas sp.]
MALALLVGAGCRGPASSAPAVDAAAPPPPGAPGPDFAGAPPGMPQMPTTAETEYSAGIYVVDGRYVKDRSLAGLVYSGQVGDTSATGVRIASDRDDLNAVLVRGKDTRYVLSDAVIELQGDGSNDFLGLGAGAMAEGGAELTLRNVQITTNGVISNAVASITNGVVKVYDSTLRANGGTLPADYVPKIGPGMKEAPAPLGIKGTARTVITANDSKSYFYNSTIIAQGWGALSTDAPGHSYLEANDSQVKVLDSGYGTYADHNCTVVINRTKFDTPTYTAIVAGEGALTLNESEADSRGNIVMVHSVMGRGPEIGHVNIHGGKYVSKEAAILVKSANADIVVDGADIASGSGEFLKSVVNDDSHATKVAGQRVSGINATLKNATVAGDVIHGDGDRDLRLSLQDATLKGAVTGAQLRLDGKSKWTATADSRVTLLGPVELAQIDAPAGVVVQATAGEGNALKHGDYPLAGGGKLRIE